MFIDDYHLKVARTFDAMSATGKTEVPPERQSQIRERETEVLQRHNRGPGTLSVMVGMEQICRDLSEGQTQPNSLWEYNNYYREASNFAHPTTWHLFSYRAKRTPTTEIVPSPDTGYRALLVAGGSFLRILQEWNNNFKRLPEKKPFEWLREWGRSLPK
jgi:hypothetical protein